jgi:nucleoside-diphosphate-sugar epimerase
MNVLLTGATGYIGSAVAEALQASGHSVLGLARSDEAARRLESLGIGVVRGDLRMPETLAAAMGRVDGVIHTAATKDGEMPQLDREAVAAMLAALAGTGKPFVYTSGTWILGNTDDSVADNPPPNPIPLMAWRVEIEQQVVAAAERQVRGIVIRPGMVYGRGGGLVAKLVAGGRQEGVVRLVGTGENRWALVHVEDLARCYVSAVERSPGGMIFNVADDRSLSLGEIALAASRAAGIPGRLESQSLASARQEMGLLADGWVLHQPISSTPARQLLDWKPIAPSLLEELERGSYTTGLMLPKVEGVDFSG